MMGKFVLIGTMLLLSVVLSRSMDITSPSPQIQELTTLVIEETATLPSVGKLESEVSDRVELSSVGPSSIKQIDLSSMDKLEPSSSVSLALESETSAPITGDVMTSKATDELLTSHNVGHPSDILASVSSDQENSTVMDSSMTVLPRARIVEPSTASANSTLLSTTTKDDPGLPADDFIATTLSSTQAGTDHGPHGGGEMDDTDHRKVTSKPRDLTTSRYTASPNKPDKGATPKDKNTGKIILIAVITVILILLLVTIVFLMIRKKKRSGSFRTNSRKGARDDVWAGQVPELGDGKATQDSTMVENGTAGTKSEPPQEQEMVTFVSGEKTMDSVEEANELEAGRKVEANGGETPDKETTPLLAEESQTPQQPDGEEDQLPPPI
ncbi:leukosialin-like [Hyperolius riggenbachi]|uniref:leukosialin-like n=1 Tax=Hyperolius riggenbachi TaxID=752182 RepID=UPI0035A3BE96